MALVRITPSDQPTYPLGFCKVWVCGLRVHHGTVGCLALLASLFPKKLPHRLLGLALGSYLAIDDWNDRREWFGNWA